MLGGNVGCSRRGGRRGEAIVEVWPGGEACIWRPRRRDDGIGLDPAAAGAGEARCSGIRVDPRSKSAGARQGLKGGDRLGTRGRRPTRGRQAGGDSSLQGKRIGRERERAEWLTMLKSNP